MRLSRQANSHLAAAPLIRFDLRTGLRMCWAAKTGWTDYRPAELPDAVRIVHHKTGELVWLPLSDEAGPLFPELTAYLDGLERLGIPIVLRKPKRKKSNRLDLSLSGTRESGSGRPRRRLSYPMT